MFLTLNFKEEKSSKIVGLPKLTGKLMICQVLTSKEKRMVQVAFLMLPGATREEMTKRTKETLLAVAGDGCGPSHTDMV